MGTGPELHLHFLVARKVKHLGEEDRMAPKMLLINSPMGPVDEMIVPGDLEDIVI